MKIILYALVLAASLLLPGCGGGGGSSASTNPPGFNPSLFTGTWSGTWTEVAPAGVLYENGNIALNITGGNLTGEQVQSVAGTITLLGGSLTKSGTMSAPGTTFSSSKITEMPGSPPAISFPMPGQLLLNSTSGITYPINWSPIILESSSSTSLISGSFVTRDAITGLSVYFNLTRQ